VLELLDVASKLATSEGMETDGREEGHQTGIGSEVRKLRGSRHDKQRIVKPDHNSNLPSKSTFPKFLLSSLERGRAVN